MSNLTDAGAALIHDDEGCLDVLAGVEESSDFAC